MCFPAQLNLKELRQSIRVTMLVTAIVAGQLVGCGGGGGSGDATLDSVVSSASVSSSSEPASSSEPVPSSEAATGSFTLNWTAPTTRSDGSPLSLSDIAGYRIYYGSSQGDYPNSVNLNDGSADSAVVENIPVGSYFVSMTTYDVYGLESGYSSTVTKQVY